MPGLSLVAVSSLLIGTSTWIPVVIAIDKAFVH